MYLQARRHGPQVRLPSANRPPVRPKTQETPLAAFIDHSRRKPTQFYNSHLVPPPATGYQSQILQRWTLLEDDLKDLAEVQAQLSGLNERISRRDLRSAHDLWHARSGMDEEGTKGSDPCT